MKKFDGLLICTDLDGTLLKNDKTISKENLSAIEYFKQNGGVFTFVTGRMPFFVSDMYNAVKPNGPIGCINGGGVYDFKEQAYLWQAELDKSALELVDYAEEKIPEIGFQVNTFDKTYFCKENSAMAEFRKITGLPNLVCRHRDVKEPMAKIVFGDEKEENIIYLKELLDGHPLSSEFDFIRSEKTLYEILPKGIGKGTVVKKVSELMGIDINKTIAVGDYNNDISMLRAAKIGVAVSNACDAAKAAADYITVSNEESAIAKIISDIESGVLKI